MSYYFEGDLCQMSKQRDLLYNCGIKVIMSNIYPTVKTEEEYINALLLIWNRRCEGWWHYEKQYIKYSICRKSEYMKRLCHGNLYLKHMIDDDLIPNWDKWWELIEGEKIKINDIPVKSKRIKEDDREITKLFYEGYKPFKEKYIKRVADEYKDKIPKKIYDALYRYEVEITD